MHSKPYEAPRFTSLGRIDAITAGHKSGFSDDGGHAGYKEEGGTIDQAPLADIPALTLKR